MNGDFSALDPDAMLTPDQLAGHLRISSSLLSHARTRSGQGPAFIAFGPVVRYRVRCVRAWIADCASRSAGFVDNGGGDHWPCPQTIQDWLRQGSSPHTDGYRDTHPGRRHIDHPHRGDR